MNNKNTICTEMTTVILPKGSEDILYDHIDGDTLVDYYLICTRLLDDRVLDVMSFAYSAEQDTYFTLDEVELLTRLTTFNEVDQFRVADQHAAHADCELSLEALFDRYPPYKHSWEVFRANQYQ